MVNEIRTSKVVAKKFSSQLRSKNIIKVTKSVIDSILSGRIK